MLLGFWRAFRSDELSRRRVEHVTFERGHGMTLDLPRTKGDRALKGTEFKARALLRLCPAGAQEAWVAATAVTRRAAASQAEPTPLIGISSR